MVGDHPGVLEFGVRVLVPEEGDEIVVAGGKEVHGKFWFAVFSVEPGYLATLLPEAVVVVLVLVED